MMNQKNMTPRSATIAIAAILALGTTSIGSAQDAPPAEAELAEAAPAPADATPVAAAPVLPDTVAPASPIVEPAPSVLQSPFATTPTVPATNNPFDPAPTTTTGERQFNASPTVQPVEEPESALIDPIAAPTVETGDTTASTATATPASSPVLGAESVSGAANASTQIASTDAGADLDAGSTDPLFSNNASEGAFDTTAPIALPADAPASNNAIAPAGLTDNSQIMAIGAAAIALIAGLIVMLLFWRRRKPLPIHEKARAKRRAPLKPMKETTPETINIPAPQAKTDSFAKLSSVADTGSSVRAAKPAPSETLVSAQATKHYRPLPHAGAAIALPAKAPETVEGRTQLLNEMAAAKPDRANPFVAHKARKRRARMILQSLGRTFENGSKIDFSQYPQNFPELAEKQKVAA